MKKNLALTAFVLVLSTMLSGCFTLREFTWSPEKVKAGDTATGDLGLIGSGSGMGESGYFFISLAGKSSEGITFKKFKFDSRKVLGNKPLKMVADQDLADAYAAEGCQLSPISEGLLFRTKKPVDSGTRKLPHATFRLNTTDESTGFFGFVATGDWTDDGDGVPEDPDSSDDEISCTGSTTTVLPFSGGLPPAARTFDLEAALGG